MKLTVNKSSLESCVKKLGKVISKKNALPILGDFLCMADEKKKTLTMSGSDGNMWLHYVVTLEECVESGGFCIKADMLKDALSELSEQPLMITADTENMRLSIQHEAGQTQLPLESSDDYPTPQYVSENANEWKLESELITRVLKRSMFATANDGLRPIMNCVHFDQRDGKLNVVASDGKMLILNAEEVMNSTGSFNMHRQVAKILPDLMDDGDVEILFNERMVQFSYGDTTFVFIVVEGKYPNYAAVIPTDSPHSLQVDRQALLKALRNVAHFANNHGQMVKLDINQDHLTIYGEDYDFAYNANHRIDITNEECIDMKMGVKASSLINVLSRIVGKTITIHFIDPTRAITITPDDNTIEGEEITMLLMPMLLDE